MIKRGLIILGLILFLLGTLLVISPRFKVLGGSIGVDSTITNPGHWQGSIMIIFGLILMVTSKLENLVDIATAKSYERHKKKEEKTKRYLERKAAAIERYSDPEEIKKEYLKGNIDEVKYAKKLNEILHLTGIHFKYGKKFTLDHARPSSGRYPLILDKDVDLAYAMRDRIISNSPRYQKNCEMHISKTESTKHHKGGLKPTD